MASTPSSDRPPWRQAAGLILMCLVVGACLMAADAASLQWTAPPTARVGASIGEHRASATPSPGPVSVGFAQDMSVHHEQAVLLSRMAEGQATPPVQVWARGLANMQLKEIGHMQGWLMLWNELATSGSASMSWMADAYRRSGQRHEHYERFISLCGSLGTMPGQVSSQEFERLSRLRGADFDRLFLQLMVRHHESALTMAQFAHEHAEHEVVRQLAALIVAEQRQEWMTMTSALHQPRRDQAQSQRSR